MGDIWGLGGVLPSDEGAYEWEGYYDKIYEVYLERSWKLRKIYGMRIEEVFEVGYDGRRRENEEMCKQEMEEWEEREL